jgi:hypothetical protein
MGVPNCAAIGFAKMELGRESVRGKCVGQIVKYWCWIVRLDIEDLVKQCYEWPKRNMSMRSWSL